MTVSGHATTVLARWIKDREGGRTVCWGGGGGREGRGGERRGDVVLRGESGHVEVSDGQSVSRSVGWLSDYTYLEGDMIDQAGEARC